MIGDEDLPGPLRALSAHAKRALKEGYVKPNKRVFDNAKVSDHFAIIPTLQAPKSLSEIEAKLYDMVVKRFMAVFYPSAEFMVTTRISTVRRPARSTSSRPTARCWSSRAGSRSTASEVQEDDANLVPVAAGRAGAHRERRRERAEDQAAGALLRGDPARRDGRRGQADRRRRAARGDAGEGPRHAGDALGHHRRPDQREVHAARGPRADPDGEGLPADDPAARPRRRGADQARADRQLGVPAGADGARPAQREAFMAEIAAMAERIVSKAKEYDRDTIPGDYATLATPCPNCGGVVKENYRRYTCTGKPATARLRLLDQQDPGRARLRARPRSSTSSRDKKIGPLEGFRSKAGWPFTAELKLVYDDEIDNWKLEFDFGEDAKRDGETASRSTSPASESLGACPKCKGHVYEHGTSYVCEHASARTSTCDFKSGKIILQQPVAREQMTQAAGHRQDRPARGLRLQQDAAQVQGLPRLRQRRKARSASSSSRARPRCRPARRRRRRPGRSRRAGPRDGGAARPVGRRRTRPG